ncbi:large ribosomal subunit protein mL59 [Trichomonascus vanleenenianus]|uniref:mitochondrial 54S ribosomal protein mL59 MRPL25 n=1 Tax=Trichomonascus vanleenenianus TaxID=2268995 RepID=UPI003ECB57B1
MKPSLQVLARSKAKPLASEILKSVEIVQGRIASVEPQGLPTDMVNPFFASLPVNLQNFFRRYPPPPYKTYADKPTLTNAEDANPFLSNRHPVTKRWSAPKYSLRRQSDLYKAAYRYGITHLLPKLGNDKRLYEDKHENKTPVRGSQQFKLTKGERTKETRKAEVDDAVARADEIIIAARGAAYRRRIEKKKNHSAPWF